MRRARSVAQAGSVATSGQEWAWRALLRVGLSFTLILSLIATGSGAEQAVAADAVNPIMRVSVGSGGSEFIGPSVYPRMSADGRYVAFTCAASLVPSDDPLMPGDKYRYEVYLRDTLTQAAECVSVSTGGVRGNDDSGCPSVSDDGRYIAFCSPASNLVTGDTNGAPDVFVRDRVSGTTRRVSLNENGGQAIGGVGEARISANGRYVAFTSQAALVSGDTNAAMDVYVRDLVRGVTTLVSVDSSGQQWPGGAGGISISADGRYVAFCIGINIDPGPAGYIVNQVFVRDRALGTTTEVTPLPVAWDQGADFPSLSADGRYVSFTSPNDELVPSDTNGDSDVFVKDLSTGRIELVSTDSSGEQVGDVMGGVTSLSGNGRFVGFECFYTGAFVKDRVTGVTRALPGCEQLSGDGRYAVFSVNDPGLVSNDNNGCEDVYRYDVSTITEDFTRDSAPDPVTSVPSAPPVSKPVLVLVAGLNSSTGTYNVAGGLRLGTPGSPWNYLGTSAAASALGAADVIVVPTAPDSTFWPDSMDDGVLDSTGSLAGNMFELALILQSDQIRSRTQGHPIILIGHSYGGVIIRSMLAGNILPRNNPVRDDIAGVIQFGSPNGGSPLAARANQTGIEKSAATLDLDPKAMAISNMYYSYPVGKPVVRFGGTYAPGVLSLMPKSQVGLLPLYSSLMGNVPNDGWVPYHSLETGSGTLEDQESHFGDGACWGLPNLAHSGDLPGVGKTYYGITFEQLVPQRSSSFLFPILAKEIASLTQAYTASTSLLGPLESAGTASSTAPAEAAEDVTAASLPVHSATVDSDEAVRITLSLDAPATVIAWSEAGQPSAAVHGSDGALLQCPTSTSTSDDGTLVTLVSLDSVVPGDYDFDVSLPSGLTGAVSLSGAVSGGAHLVLESGGPAIVGVPGSLTAEFRDANGDPRTGASVTGVARLDDSYDLPLTFADDGTGADETASDGIYTALFTPPARGRWLVLAEGFHDTTERATSLVLDVGEGLATVTGGLAEVVEADSEGKITSYGVSVPVQVSEEGTYTVTGSLTDGAGNCIGSVMAATHLEAGETATLVPSMDSAHLGRIAPGSLTVGPLLITRYTDGVEMRVGTASGLTSAASYSPDDFYDFSIALSGPADDPSPTGAVHFAGTAHNTPSTVASVEYSIDGSSTWQPVEALDGAFDSSHEDFVIDLDLPDYVYGIYVRQTGADGVQLPVDDWAGVRFTVDTVAPAAPTELGAVVETDTGSPVAHTSWLPSDPPLDTTALVSYTVSLDGVEIGRTCDTSLEVLLPDYDQHTIAVTPIDLAGNIGATATMTVDDLPLVVTPIAGANRYTTAIEASKKSFPTGLETEVDGHYNVVVATGRNWPDALGGAALAGALECPILLTDPLTLPDAVAAEVERLGATRAVILGGDGAVSQAVASSLDALPGVSVKRIAGASRYATSYETAEETVRVLQSKPDGYDGTAFVATGANFPDALGASPIAAAKGWPLYLVDPNRGVTTELEAAMERDGVMHAIALGGAVVVKDSALIDLASRVGCSTERWAGSDRYETALVVATHGVDDCGLSWDKVALATGQNFPDALSGGSLQGLDGSVMLLTPSTYLYSKAAEALTANKASISEIRFLGGTSAVTDAARTAAIAALE